MLIAFSMVCYGIAVTRNSGKRCALHFAHRNLQHAAPDHDPASRS